MAVETKHRRRIIEILSQGPIEDRGGRAIDKLMAETGHESTNALSKVLRSMERDGLIEREVRGRRTFRIALTDGTETGTVSPANIHSDSEDMANSEDTDAEPSFMDHVAAAPDSVDYETLAAVLLKQALRALTNQGDADTDVRRKYLAEMRRADDATAKIKDIEAALAQRSADLLDARTTIRTLEKNVKTLMGQLDKPRRGAAAIKDMVTDKERRELDKLMRELPGH